MDWRPFKCRSLCRVFFTLLSNLQDNGRNRSRHELSSWISLISRTLNQTCLKHKDCSLWITQASSPVPCHPADRHSNGAAWVSFGTDGGFVHLVSPAGAVDAAMACTARTVHTFAQLVKISFLNIWTLCS